MLQHRVESASDHGVPRIFQWRVLGIVYRRTAKPEWPMLDLAWEGKNGWVLGEGTLGRANLLSVSSGRLKVFL